MFLLTCLIFSSKFNFYLLAFFIEEERVIISITCILKYDSNSHCKIKLTLLKSSNSSCAIQANVVLFSKIKK